jgi:hypothetical protein
MGVRGLTSFLESIPAVWQELLKSGGKEDGVVKLAVDGHALLYQLYYSRNLNWAASEYSAFAKLAHEYLSALQQRGFSLLIVFNGAGEYQQVGEEDCNHENENIRRVQRIFKSNRLGEKVLPVLAFSTFCKVLRDLDVHFVVADGKADAVVASLALHHGCCAVSRDSDFFIYNLPHGYIPCESIHLIAASGGHKAGVSARLYSAARLAQHLGFKPDFLPLFASLVGNDQVTGPLLRCFHAQVAAKYPMPEPAEGEKAPSHRHVLIRAVGLFLADAASQDAAIAAAAEMLKDAENLPEGVEDPQGDFKAMLTAAAPAYQIRAKEQALLDATTKLVPGAATQAFVKGGRGGGNGTLPAWLVAAYRKGTFSARLMDIMVSRRFWCPSTLENTEESSAWLVGRDIRRVIYGICLGPESKDWGADETTVTEYLRIGPKFASEEVAATHQNAAGALPSIAEVEKLDVAARRAILLSSLASSGVPALEALAPAQLLAAAALRCWIQAAAASNSKLGAWEVGVLVAVMVSEKESPLVKSKASKDDRPSWLTSKSMHRMAQWQVMMESADLLNEALLQPLEALDAPAVFDGPLAHRCYHTAGKGSSMSMVLKKAVGDEDVFRRLFDAITSGILNDLEGELVMEGVNAVHVGALARAVPAADPFAKVKIASRNVFDGLVDEPELTDSEDEEEAPAAPAVEVKTFVKKEKKKAAADEEMERLLAEMEAVDLKKAAADEAKAAKKKEKKAAQKKGKK